MFKDIVRLAESGFARLRTSSGAILLERLFSDPDLDRPLVEVEGFVDLCLRERGKIVKGSRRSGHNIWTNTGREYLALLMSIQTLPTTPYRTDSMAYIGVGTGSQVEDVGILSLATPVAYSGGLFLAALDVPPTFPLTPSRTTVQYHRTFAENEITITPSSSVQISEAGLFTNGGPASNFSPGTRDLTLANASQQAPNAYKSFEPVGKRDDLQLEVSWQIRF